MYYTTCGVYVEGVLQSRGLNFDILIYSAGDPWHFGTDPYLWLTNPDADLGGPKTYGSYKSGSGTGTLFQSITGWAFSSPVVAKSVGNSRCRAVLLKHITRKTTRLWWKILFYADTRVTVAEQWPSPLNSWRSIWSLLTMDTRTPAGCSVGTASTPPG